jgi:hypothetical protein
MYKMILTFSLVLLSANIVAFADDAQQVITLKDGSQIKGELAGVANGTYTIKTPIIGDVHVAASDVASITNGSATTAMPAIAPAVPAVPTSAGGSLDQQIASSQQQLMSNPQSMAILTKMTQDPEIMQALQDPALVQAVTNHDYAAVQNNPAVQKLMNDPTMRAYVQQLAAQQAQQKTSSQ